MQSKCRLVVDSKYKILFSNSVYPTYLLETYTCLKFWNLYVHMVIALHRNNIAFKQLSETLTNFCFTSQFSVWNKVKLIRHSPGSTTTNLNHKIQMQCLPAPVLYKQKEDRTKDALTWLFLPLISLSVVSQLVRQRFFWFDNETLDPLIKSSVSWSSKTKHMLHFEGCFSCQILQKSYMYIHYNPWQNEEYIATIHTHSRTRHLCYR